jgi:SAM-dependent methyltransferase
MRLLEITKNLTMVEEEHVGGFLIQKDPATYTPILWKYICEKYSVKSVLDVGCGMGHAIENFLNYCDDVVGIDGSQYVIKNSLFNKFIQYHDFTIDSPDLKREFDFCWSCEFVEHVEEKYMHNFLKIFASSKLLAITYAEPGQPGHHHVNCQPKEYWIDNLKKYGFAYNEKVTQELRNISLKDAFELNPIYKDNHFYNRGLFFERIK